MQVIWYVLIGLVAGLSSGMFGIGGGIVIVPALVIGLGFQQQRAQGTALVGLLAPVGLLAFLEYLKKGETDVKAGIIIAIALFAGAYFGAKISLGLPEIVMRRAFAGLLTVVAVWLFLKK